MARKPVGFEGFDAVCRTQVENNPWAPEGEVLTVLGAFSLRGRRFLGGGRRRRVFWRLGR